MLSLGFVLLEKTAIAVLLDFRFLDSTLYNDSDSIKPIIRRHENRILSRDLIVGTFLHVDNERKENQSYYDRTTSYLLELHDHHVNNHKGTSALRRLVSIVFFLQSRDEAGFFEGTMRCY